MSFLPHLAFDLQAIAKIPYKIVDVALLRNHVLLATNEGLLIYRVDSHSPRCVLLHSDKKFSKKSTQQLAALAHPQPLIVSLSDAVYVHRLSLTATAAATRLAATVQKSKNASLFALDYSSHVPLLCVAVKKKLLLLSLRDVDRISELRELSLAEVPRMLHFCADRVCVGFKREYKMVNLNTGALSDVWETGKSGVPLAVPLPEKQMLVLRDDIGAFAYYDGRPSGRTAVTFSETPLAIAYCFPFIVAALPRMIEVRGVAGAQGLKQQMPAQGVLRLVAMPREKRVDNDNNNVDDDDDDESAPQDVFAVSSGQLWRLRAVPLVEQCDKLVHQQRFESALALCDAMPVDTHDRAERLKQIKDLYARHLFATGHYKEALDYFGELRVFPLDVLGMYADLLPAEAAASLKSQPVPLKGAKRVAAHKALIDYIGEVRRGGDSAPEIRALLDTALLKAYLIGDPSELMAFLDTANDCELEASERALLDADRHAELVQLYFSKALHRKALELLTKLAHARSGAMAGFDSLIRYLARLPAAESPLVLQYSRAPLKAVPRDALAIFTAERGDAAEQTLPRDAVLKHLRQCAPQLVQEYLEHILQRAAQRETRAEFHDMLANEYLNTVLALKRNQVNVPGASAVKAGQEPGLLGVTRTKLLAFLDTSRAYHAEALLARCPLDDLYPERAILLARLGQHETALALYVHTLNDFDAAESYCEKRWLETHDTSVYLALLRVTIDSKGADSVTALVNRYASRLDPAAALALLDDNVRVAELQDFFLHALCRRTADSRVTSIVAGLQRSAHQHTKEELLEARARSRIITRNDLCAVCNKRMGAAVFSLLPNNDVVHFMCVEKLQKK